jgi:tetratricopeptide (TPR) repeat protein
MLGDLARSRGDYERARAIYRENLDLLSKLKVKRNVPSTLHNMAYLMLHQGEVQQAKGNFFEALDIFRQEEDRKGIAECLAGLACVLARDGDVHHSARMFGAVAAARESMGVKLWLANRLDHDRYLAEARTQLGEAGFQVEWEAGRALTLEQALAEL